MLRTIDRYVIREAIVPTLLGLLVFTFILQIQPVMEVAERLIAKGVAWSTVGRIMLTLLPQALGITIPMAVLMGLLVSLGRLSADREAVALQACGVSLYRLLVPVGVVAGMAWVATSWVLIYALPAANQAYREIVYSIVAARAENEVRPRVFFEDFPNLVLYVRDTPAQGSGWRDVFLADSRRPSEPTVFMAKEGRMVLDRAARRVDLLLQNGTQHRVPAARPDKYEVQRFESLTFALDPDAVFPRTGPQRGDNEMTIAQLRAEIARRESEGQATHNQVMTIQKKFSIPMACLVFGLLGLGLGITNRKDGKQSSFVVAIAVIFVYYVFMYSGESMAKARWIPAGAAMWIPNVLLGAAGVALLVWRARHGDTGGRISIRLPWRLPPRREAPPQRAAPVRVASDRGRTVLVVRVPQFPIPTLRIIDRYVGGTYLRVFGIAFVGMLALFYIATFIDLSDKLFKGQATLGQLLQFFWYSTPQYIYYVLPISALITTLVTIGLLTRTSELIVMKACGISLYRATLPLIGFGLLWSAVLFGLGESILAHANRQAQALNHVIRGGSPRTFDVLSRQWVAGRDGSLYNFLAFSPRERELDGLSIYRFASGTWNLALRTFVTEARFVEGTWVARRGWTRTFDQATNVKSYEPFERGTVPIEAVDYFMTERPDAERMSYRQLRQYVGELQTSGFNVTPYVVALHRKLSFPIVTVIMTLIAVPFAVTTGRRGALYGIGVGIVLALAYWLIFSVFAAIGTAGLLSPPLAAWAPNILFAAIAVYLLLTVRT